MEKLDSKNVRLVTSEIYNEHIKRYKLKAGDFAYGRVASVGKVVDLSNNVDKIYTYSPTMAIIQPKCINPVYLKFFCESEFFVTQVKSKTTGSTRKSIGMQNLRILKIATPKDEVEQQKIANCLSSIDDVIEAEIEKLDGLKDHKKGLLQQLFPLEGETIPRLRFPGFKNDGEWRKTELGKCLLQHPEYGIGAPAVTYDTNLPTYLRITDISVDGRFLIEKQVSVDRDVTKDNFLNEGDIAFARTGASVGKAYKYRIEDGRLVFAGFLIRVKPDPNKLISELLFQFVLSEQYWKWVTFTSARSGQPGINGKEYASMPLFLPPTLMEQKKIADCLTSVYDSIEAQSEKIGSLKNHKKGLMQQLFPNINEINT